MSQKNPYLKNVSANFKAISQLNKKQAREQIDELREALEHHNYRYYVKNQPEISDEQYDILFRRLQDLEEAYPDLQTDDSPTRRVGTEPVDALIKVDHTSPLLSLNSALQEKEILSFLDFVDRNIGEKNPLYVAEPKLDGLSVEVVYREGQFQYGATRGNGRTGEDISENLKTIGSVPLKLRKKADPPAFLAVRGEVMMSRDGFQKLNKQRIEQGENPFANPRNAAAGIVRQLDSKKVADKPLTVFFYDILNMSANGFSSHWEILKVFPEWGFKVHPTISRCRGWEDIKKFRESLAEKRDDLEYEIDGIVIKLDSLHLREKLGTRERSPRWALAWKFPPQKEITILKEIVVQVGRTGMLTPVALLDPVNVGGVTVSRATLHNEDEVKKKDVRPGDKVRIIRAGDVIPEVAERLPQPNKKRGPKFTLPNHCPVCGSEVVREGAYVFCQAGLSCPAQLIGSLIHYASKEALDIETLGEKNVRQLVNRDLVNDISDLYHLQIDDLKKLEGFAEKSAEKLYRALQSTKNPLLHRFIYALGIRHVGRHIARVLARSFGSLDELMKAEVYDLEAINEIGPEIAQSVYGFFKEEKNRDILKRLNKAGVRVQTVQKKKKPQALEGKTFVFTGALKNLTRGEAQKRVEELGGRVSSSVSKKTDYLVEGENPGSKL
ncbi:MAG: NAD-dependent DNA ligase LigA [bacterium]